MRQEFLKISSEFLNSFVTLICSLDGCIQHNCQQNICSKIQNSSNQSVYLDVQRSFARTRSKFIRYPWPFPHWIHTKKMWLRIISYIKLHQGNELNFRTHNRPKTRNIHELYLLVLSSSYSFLLLFFLFFVFLCVYGFMSFLSSNGTCLINLFRTIHMNGRNGHF